MNEPVNNSQPTNAPTGDYIPSPADNGLTRGNVYHDETQLVTMESYPLKFALRLKGNLPTPCDHLRIAANPPDAQNKIIVDVYSVSDPNAMCAQVLQPFDVNFQLGSYPTGHYTLWVNGKQIAEIDS